MTLPNKQYGGAGWHLQLRVAVTVMPPHYSKTFSIILRAFLVTTCFHVTMTSFPLIIVTSRPFSQETFLIILTCRLPFFYTTSLHTTRWVVTRNIDMPIYCMCICVRRGENLTFLSRVDAAEIIRYTEPLRFCKEWTPLGWGWFKVQRFCLTLTRKC